ncbi:MAG: hypothetical protein TREMPRED_002966 [Tremellales sp. Tagirdzhanova-0007]|nr:MAG: hypothetical protein TREMPRED_002966 [Tremellales sp. Tagirdzhanova-0007]
MSSDAAFVDKQADIPETNLNPEKEDAITAESDATGQVSQQEVSGLKDTIGGGQVLNDSEGYTRSSNKDVKPMQQEQAVDAAVDQLE